jgi:hypothetical protein
MRLLKFWKSRFIWPAGLPVLQSYFLELATIYICDRFMVSTPPKTNTEFMKAFFKFAESLPTLNVDLGNHGSLIPPEVLRECVKSIPQFVAPFF